MHIEKKLNTTQKLLLSLGALGVVYGDIGTSPLYAIKEIFFGHSKLVVSQPHILGVMSLVFWALTLIVSFKYVVLVLRADHDGEGGVFALYGLLNKKNLKGVFVLGSILILAAGLLLGDGVITPAISVISSVEGLEVLTGALHPYILPLTILILTGLFFIQSYGTDKIGKLFGPIIAIWFLAIGVLGASQILQFPNVLLALNPLYAIQFLFQTPFYVLLLILGSVMLVVTGGEAMYADLGHFGRFPIRFSWFTVAYPALILNYFGQGAYLLSGRPIVAENIFFSMAPDWALIPMIVLATLATIIASQALITGAYSLVSQAVALGLLPLIKTKYTHARHMGQVYIPIVNWSLYVGCIMLVLLFKSSTNLASAYGLAVSGVMLATTLSMIQIAKNYWKWKSWLAYTLFGGLACIDVLFLIANSLKILQGGYVPLAIGVAVLLVMKTWSWGKQKVRKVWENIPAMSMGELVEINKNQTQFFPRSVVIMTPEMVTKRTDLVPFLEEVIWDRYGMLPKHIIFLSVSIEKDPFCDQNRYEIKKFYDDEVKGSIQSVKVRFGFMEEPDVESVLEGIAAHDKIHIDDDPSTWLVHIAQERIFLDPGVPFLMGIRYHFFSFLLKNSQTFDKYFRLGRKARLTIESIPVLFT
ncbi:MAG TPA: KUP/HAK/KT family potassium transporter [Patescibacteria group bacterium]|nr:KUP/HAK/KT family potassium transporter [Patescibacteria group bacterium]